MDKESLEKLIADQPKEIRAKGVLLYNGSAHCAQTYQSAPTAANLRDWEAAQAALAKFAEQLGVQDDAERPFPTIADVLEHLKEKGWSVTKTSLYRHHKEGKFLPQRDGSYARKDIDKYARTWLKQKSTGKKIREKIDYLQEINLQYDRDLKELKIRREKIATLKDEGLYIPKELMEVELAARAGILNAGLKHWIQSRAADWIRAGGGDTKHAGELINLMSRDLDEHINSYASALEYELVVDAEEEAGDTTPETGDESTGGE